jgi:hypothetical protein
MRLPEIGVISGRGSTAPSLYFGAIRLAVRTHGHAGVRSYILVVLAGEGEAAPAPLVPSVINAAAQIASVAGAISSDVRRLIHHLPLRHRSCSSIHGFAGPPGSRPSGPGGWQRHRREGRCRPSHAGQAIGRPGPLIAVAAWAARVAAAAQWARASAGRPEARNVSPSPLRATAGRDAQGPEEYPPPASFISAPDHGRSCPGQPAALATPVKLAVLPETATAPTWTTP